MNFFFHFYLLTVSTLHGKDFLQMQINSHFLVRKLHNIILFAFTSMSSELNSYSCPSLLVIQQTILLYR